MLASEMTSLKIAPVSTKKTLFSFNSIAAAGEHIFPTLTVLLLVRQFVYAEVNLSKSYPDLSATNDSH